MCILASFLSELVAHFATVCVGVSFSSHVNDGSSLATRCNAADKIVVVFETSKAICKGKHGLAAFGNVKKIYHYCYVRKSPKNEMLQHP